MSSSLQSAIKMEGPLAACAIGVTFVHVLKKWYPGLFRGIGPGNVSDVADVKYYFRKPDMMKLSRDLPSGWKAYYDQNSYQVFYVNEANSEIAWTRPTN